MRDLVFLPINLIKEAEQDGWLRSLAYFVRCKSLYQNNTHYNFSLRTLGERIKCSPACLSAHLKVLEGKGLITYHSGNITFSGLRKMQSRYSLKNVGVPVDFKNQHDILRGQIIRFNLSAQSYNIRKSGIQLWRKGFVPITKDEKANSSYTGLSAKRIGSLFNRSAGSGSRIRKKLKDLTQFSVTPVYSVLFDKTSLIDFKNMRKQFTIPPYSFYREGRILIQRRSCMEYVGNPLTP